MPFSQTIRADRLIPRSFLIPASLMTSGMATALSCCCEDAKLSSDMVDANYREEQNNNNNPLVLGHHLSARRSLIGWSFQTQNKNSTSKDSHNHPTILATFPRTDSSSSSDSQAIDISRWWTFHLWSPQFQSSTNKTSWLERICKTFFVITRGVEIVVRLSPLLILVPTSLLVSRADSLVRQLRQPKRSIILSTSSEMSVVDDDLYVKQFEIAHARGVYVGQTWASNLAWRYTLHTLQVLGPAFSKLGQWAATRRDLFPSNMCNRLSELHDMANTHSFEYTHNTLKKAFGNYEAKGLTVNNAVLGSGSAAQVHKGTLTLPVQSNNEPRLKTVAIKVLHPNTRTLVERDLALMQQVADFIDACIPLEIIRMLSLPRAVHNFSDIMTRQVDLRIERDNLNTFRANFGCTKAHSTIDFPSPMNEFVSEHVLVEDHVDDAKPISIYLDNDTPEGLEVRRKLAAPLLRAFLKMVFIDNFVHSDLHPGNVLVRESEKDTYSIVFLDAGIAMSLKPRDQQNLRDLFKAVVLNDGYTAGSLMVDRARYEHCSSIPGGKHAFSTGIADIVSEFHENSKKGLTLGAVRVGSLLGRVLDLCRRYGVEIDPEMASVVISMLVLEGLGRSLDPDLNLMEAALPFLLGGGRI